MGGYNGGRRTGEIDTDVRSRIVAWVRYEMSQRTIAGDPISARYFAEKLGVSHAYLSRMLSNAQTPGMEFLIRFVKFCGLNAHDVLFKDPPHKYFQIGSEKNVPG